jgi:hypothetical protein
MEALDWALPLACRMYARNWVGKVDWYIDNMGVINNFRKMHRWGVANDWSKAGDRDVPSSTRYNGSTGFGRYSPLGGAGKGEGSEE